MGSNIGIDERDTIHKNTNVMKLLLKNNNTNRNIVWATENYQYQGFMPQDEISIEDVAIIQPRIQKERKIQLKRTKEKAEVFTPTTVVHQQVDEVIENFIDNRFINSTWLEITCGEAPYITSRYDVTSGRFIECDQRVGFLDKKLNLVSKSILEKNQWMECVQKIYQKTYGYEFHGDSLLLARENLLLTFIDYYKEKFNEYPDTQEIEIIADIISKNIIQADGLTGFVPFSEVKVIPKLQQLSLFDDIEEVVEPQIAQFYDWSSNHYKQLYGQGGEQMKFDVVIGNPPYQIETAKKETKNGQKKTKNVFQYFQMQADQIANEYTCLIYPGVRWIHRTNKDVQSFGLKQMNDPHLKKLIFYPDANSCFQGVSIGGGISIVIKDMHKVSNSFLYEYRSDTVQATELGFPGGDLFILNPKDQIIISKVVKLMEEHHLSSYSNSSYINQKFFGIESNFVENNPDRVRPLDAGNQLEDDEIKVFTNDKGGKAGRAKWFIMKKEDVQKNSEYIDKWKVIVSSANGGVRSVQINWQS